MNKIIGILILIFTANVSAKEAGSYEMMYRCMVLASNVDLDQKGGVFADAGNILYLKNDEANRIGDADHNYSAGFQEGYIKGTTYGFSDSQKRDLYYTSCEKGLLKYAKDLNAE